MGATIVFASNPVFTGYETDTIRVYISANGGHPALGVAEIEIFDSTDTQINTQATPTVSGSQIGWGADKLTDGLFTLAQEGWYIPSFSPGAWAEFVFPSTKVVKAIRIYKYNVVGSGSHAADFLIQVGSNHQTVKSVSGLAPGDYNGGVASQGYYASLV